MTLRVTRWRAASRSLLTVAALTHRVPSPAQGAVSIMAAMLIPVTSVGASGYGHVTRRVLQRVAGCVAGASFAVPFLIAAHASAWAMLAGTVFGVAIGRHIENGGHAHRYIGTQFTLAVLVTLVPDAGVLRGVQPGLDRLAGILVGASILTVVLFGWYFLAPATSNAGPVPPDPADEHGGI